MYSTLLVSNFAAQRAFIFRSRFDAVLLNPQPLPPRYIGRILI